MRGASLREFMGEGKGKQQRGKVKTLCPKLHR